MPEGPSIIILKEIVENFRGKKILEAVGNAKIDKEQLINKKVTDCKSFGKHFLICIGGLTVRIHFLLFGSYSLDAQTKPDKSLRLCLTFKNGSLFFYTCAVKIITEDLNTVYDWTADVMNDQWDNLKAIKKLKQIPNTLICDALLDQTIFAGVGNIIKNEVLYREKIHPASFIGKIPPKRLTKLVKEVRHYSFDFLEWKKLFVLKKNWKAHTKKTCYRCDLPMIKMHLGETNRRSFFCCNCQVKYT